MAYVPEPGYIEGLNISTISATEVTINPGVCRDSTNQYDIRTNALLTADITVSGANGLDAGLEQANTWYAVHIIDGPAVAVASLLSESAAAPTLPAGYIAFRRVGWTRNSNGSNLLQATQIGSGPDRETFYNNNLATLAVLSGGVAAIITNVDCSAFIPPTALMAQFTAAQTTAGGPTLTVRGLVEDATLAAPIFSIPSAEANCALPLEYFYLTLSSSQLIQYVNSGGGGTSDIYLVSYIDLLD
jgi:hypothetical protein